MGYRVWFLPTAFYFNTYQINSISPLEKEFQKAKAYLNSMLSPNSAPPVPGGKGYALDIGPSGISL